MNSNCAPCECVGYHHREQVKDSTGAEFAKLKNEKTRLYNVTIREVWTSQIHVEAKSGEHATRLVSYGEGDEVDNSLEFSHRLGSETWTAEVVE